jgi:hypothetical protein
MALAPRHVTLLGLLALAPVIAYAVGKPDLFNAAVTAVNVVIIAASLWIATGPSSTNGHAH